VIGNHEYYNNTVKHLHETVATIADKHQNMHWLDNGVVTIDHQRFLGSTLWFPFQESNKKYERPMADFGQIPQFRDWVYEENRRSQDFLQATTTEADVVITHFLPTHRSVAQQYLGSPFNRFFVCPMDDLIDEAQPRLWIHGHTHVACLHQMGATRVVCNPFGYESIDEKAGFCPWLILETEV
jgi:Icc-related predicted phosphoesterase